METGFFGEKGTDCGLDGGEGSMIENEEVDVCIWVSSADGGEGRGAFGFGAGTEVDTGRVTGQVETCVVAADGELVAFRCGLRRNKKGERELTRRCFLQ